MFHHILDAITGENEEKKIKGTVVLMKKDVLDFNDFNASILDGVHELLGQKVFLQLVSAVNADPGFDVSFDWDDEIGVPGAFIIRNLHYSEFYLKSLTLDQVPGHGRIHFVCNSWVYPADKYKTDRVFFTNQTFLPSETPALLISYREEELVNLRGNGAGELKEWDRVYDYAYYNDLGDPDKGPKYVRPVLGGTSEYPYPRTGRTGRAPTKTDPKTESRLPLLISVDIYVPRDERFGHLKMSDFLANSLKSIVQFLLPEFEAPCDTHYEFDSFADTLKLYEGGIKLPESPLLDEIKENIPFEMLKDLLQTDDDKTAWRTDEEFGREMLAGVNPVIISRVPSNKQPGILDPKVYGNQDSSITRDHIENNLDGLTIEEALRNKKLFILDHHDTLMPYPLAIELSLPNPKGDQFGAISKLYTLAEDGVEASVWQLTKAYVVVNDSGHHQLISHWLNTHAVIEPFVIATNSQLSVLHPIHKLLHPHFRDTMTINALGRQTLINAGALLADLIKRGMVVEDANAPHGLRLLIKDYPYPVDGLKIWSAIETWVHDYCHFYYKDDQSVQADSELQSWWKELREEGHGDKKDEPWWPKMQTLKDLIDTCTIIIWVGSALHAAVNFGQYSYAGYIPNRPTISRRFMPEPGSAAYEELKANPEKAFLKTITAQLQTLLGISSIEIFSRHSLDQVYLGQRDTAESTTDVELLEAFGRFRKELGEIEDEIVELNSDEKLKNRVGPVKVPYTLLFPTSESGLTGKRIANSVSI
ncbi:hypothetical protein Vadar_024296 [Vaccinium darrowii]|uniref:Uncharacterized protein n=1 Tax=Vaccinium darrowii TaxID=229202 RepID=A0ACB7Y283_9ERIC|nr:hypothetical protein Vadar_024296 [Vaccinium darrowii]